MLKSVTLQKIRFYSVTVFLSNTKINWSIYTLCNVN